MHLVVQPPFKMEIFITTTSVTHGTIIDQQLYDPLVLLLKVILQPY